MNNKLWNRIQEATKAKKYIYVPMKQEEALESNRSYLRIFIAEMFLESKFAWFKSWYPTVNVAVQLQFGDQEASVISRVVKPPADAVKDGVLRNYQILPLTPFTGGTVEVQAALLAMKGADYLGAAIDVLQDFSSLVAPPLGQALNIAEKVANGLDNLMEATDGDARLPYHDTFVGRGQGENELRPGYLAIIRAEEDELDPAQLSVEDGRLHITTAGEKSTPFRDADYVLLRIDGPSSRDDYRQLSSIATPFQNFFDALEIGDLDTAVAAERALRVAVLRCADLTRFDRPVVLEAITKEIQVAKEAFGLVTKGVKSGSAVSVRTLDDIIMDELRRRSEEDKQATGQEVLAKSAVPKASHLPDEDPLDWIDDEVTIEERRERERVIYGEENRRDLFEGEVAGSRAIMADADSVVSLWKASDLEENDDGTISLSTRIFKRAYNLCDDETFADQPIGAYCSGVLLAPDIIATAGHCVGQFDPRSPNLDDIRVVFGFRMRDENEAVLTVNKSEVYRAKELLDGILDNRTGRDWSVIRLDRPVTNHRIASLRREGTIADETAVHVIGHPCGLPAKYAPDAEVRDNTPTAHFVANLDTYGGNSGSPVFNSETHEVEGLLVRGATDFVKRGNCYVSNVCPQINGTPNCRGEDVIRSTQFSGHVPAQDE